ncbi:hypothetical protein [Alteromonas halophila]|uniref:Uncharacterized protein n=1 Tax=Alteromonas halophila TaxID=516698 RepID=A0A918JBU7_9ALTE|nr:hypothetical protein [Alteromonas halophila]GGW72826.1 hypothetical protein GCM10007391_00410 [Alteromonas halophila]
MIQLTRACCYLLGLTSVISGCTSVPQETHADIPLVHDSISYSRSSDKAKNVPDSGSPSSGTVQIGGQAYVVLGTYISASGNQCRRLNQSSAASNVQAHRALCNRNGQWQLLEPLVSSPDKQDW